MDVMKSSETLRLFGKWWTTWKTLPVFSWVRAAACYRAGKFSIAERHYLAGLAKHPDHPANLCARLDLAYCLFKQQKLEEAERHLRHVTTRSPHSREGYLRLARLQMWTGHSLEAGWTMRRALQRVAVDAETAGTFLLAVLDADAPAYLIAEAVQAAQSIELKDGVSYERLKLALARLDYQRRDRERGREVIAEMACRERAVFDAILAFAKILVDEGKVAHARRQLRRAMTVASDHPRILEILALSYLKAGPFYNAEYAVQQATKACQSAGWKSPAAMHVLAEAFYHHGDKISALLIASKAKQAGSRLMGSYSGVQNLDRLIESLSENTLA